MRFQGLIFLLMVLWARGGQAQQAPHLSADEFEQKFLTPAEEPSWFGRILKDVASKNFQFRTGVNESLIEGLNAAVQYRYRYEPSYKKGFFTRVDSWTLRVGLAPWTLLAGDSAPFYLNIEPGATVTFARQFKCDEDPQKSPKVLTECQRKAMLAMPSFVHQVPTSARRALKHMEVGDFVSLPTQLNLAAGFAPKVNSGLIDTGPNLFYLIQGFFDVQIFRLDPERFRLRILARRRQGPGGHFELGVGLDVFEVSLLDKGVRKLLFDDFVSLGYAEETGSLFLLDYIFNFNTPEGQKAYDQILNSHYTLKNPALVAPFMRGDEMAQKVIANAVYAEQIFREDRSKPPQKRRVERLFQGRSDYSQNRFSFEFDIRLFEFEWDTFRTDNRIEVVDKWDQREIYFYPTVSRARELEILWGLVEDERLDESYIGLFKQKGVDGEFEFQHFGLRFYLDDEYFSKRSQIQFMAKLKGHLPRSLYREIDFKNWTTGESLRLERSSRERSWREQKSLGHQGEILVDRRGARVSLDVVFHPPAFEFFAQLPDHYIEAKLDEYYENWYRHFGKSFNDLQAPAIGMRRLKRHLKRALRKSYGLPDRERIELLLELRTNKFFYQAGMGFLIHLLPQRKLEDYVFIRVRMLALDAETVEYIHGDLEDLALYEELVYIQMELNRSNLDLRLTDRHLNIINDTGDP